MKKFYILLVCLTVFCIPTVKAQVNIQEMYDFGRHHLSTTLEVFHGDKWGNTFIFTDIYHPSLFKPTGFYTEIGRALNFWNKTALRDFSVQVQWNGGQFANNAWLAGIQYCFHDANFNNTLTLLLMYKNIRPEYAGRKMSDVPLQITAVWGCNNLFGVKGLSFSGFIDFWWENVNWGTSSTSVVMLAEPQLWYSVGQHFNCPNLNIGGEVEMACNFTGGRFVDSQFLQNKGFTVAPCLGLKWIF